MKIRLCRPNPESRQRDKIRRHSNRALDIAFHDRPRHRENHAAQEGDDQRQQPQLEHRPAFNQLDAPANVRPHLRANGQPELSLLGESHERDGAVVGFVRLVEQMRHEVLSDRRDEIDGLVEVFILARFGRHVGDLADVDQVAVMEFELEIGIIGSSRHRIYAGQIWRKVLTWTNLML